LKGTDSFKLETSKSYLIASFIIFLLASSSMIHYLKYGHVGAMILCCILFIGFFFTLITTTIILTSELLTIEKKLFFKLKLTGIKKIKTRNIKSIYFDISQGRELPIITRYCVKIIGDNDCNEVNSIFKKKDILKFIKNFNTYSSSHKRLD
jgi:hypothetical protein